MQLYSITDGDEACDGTELLYCWWIAVWAETSEAALQFAAENYSGDLGIDERFLRVSTVEELPDWNPGGSSPQEERRVAVLRLAGWRTEDGCECDSCGLNDMAEAAWRVCAECFACPDCREPGCSECDEAVQSAEVAQ